jgi:hypothetical protein
VHSSPHKYRGNPDQFEDSPEHVTMSLCVERFPSSRVSHQPNLLPAFIARINTADTESVRDKKVLEKQQKTTT